MIKVLIGQRGVGKTHLLERIKKYSPQSWFVDLDDWIEKNNHQSIESIFQEHGENYFRQLEKNSFSEILTLAQSLTEDTYISVGAGFNCEWIPTKIEVIWLRRASDEWGRIFTNRPRLDVSLTPLEEFKSRALLREKNFSRTAWFEYLMPEGLTQPDLIEKKIILNSISSLRGGLTLLPSDFHRIHHNMNDFINRRLHWGLDYFELRDDLLSKDQIDFLLKLIPLRHILYSLRPSPIDTHRSPQELACLRKEGAQVDCDYTLLDNFSLPLKDSITIISVHERDDNKSLSFQLDLFKKYEDMGFSIKMALPINTFEELFIGHHWALENPEKRNFLPRSQTGRWHWYRLLTQKQRKLNFIREGQGSSLDQPTLYQWINQEQFIASPNGFAAVLGSPVSHSYTPMIHGAFFQSKNWPIYAIDINEFEFQSALNILEKLGLKAAAVTSPLKTKAFEVCDETSNLALEFKSVNTLILKINPTHINKMYWSGYNTDLEGLKDLFKEIPENIEIKEIAVWGGGGTLPLIQKLLPEAQFYSAQSGQLRTIENEKDFSKSKIRVLIWAAPRADGKQILFPPEHWKPEYVIDLNYREDSGGCDYTLKCGGKYISGLKMFLAQAKEQSGLFK